MNAFYTQLIAVVLPAQGPPVITILEIVIAGFSHSVYSVGATSALLAEEEQCDGAGAGVRADDGVDVVDEHVLDV